MKLRTPKVFTSTARSRAREDNETFQNPTRALSPLLPSAATFRRAGTPLHGERSVVRTHRRNRRVTVDMTAFTSRCFPRTIKIPARLRKRPLSALPGSRRISTRLAHALHMSGVRVLGDLHGRRVGDFAWERNCGAKTLQELDSLASVLTKQTSSRNRGTVVTREATLGGMAFAVPKSVCALRFDELPITKRLANVIRSNGLRTLGNLHGRTPFELLQYKACGWRTIAEIHQLIERAIRGKFDVARMEESRAITELLTLLELGIAKLAPRDRQFLLARIDGMTFAKIGRWHGITRAYAHQVVVKTLGILRKTYGPRIPELLGMAKRRCLSTPRASGLTPSLLDQWAVNSTKRFRLSRKAQVRLIAALDKSFPFCMD
jgi:hypothetical protein